MKAYRDRGAQQYGIKNPEVIVPIEEIAELIKDLPQIGLHVDACLGGFILPFLQKLGHLKKKYDFEIPGVIYCFFPLSFSYSFFFRRRSPPFLLIYINTDLHQKVLRSFCGRTALLENSNISPIAIGVEAFIALLLFKAVVRVVQSLVH